MTTKLGKSIFESYISGDRKAIQEVKDMVNERDQKVRNLNKERFVIYSSTLSADNPPAVEINDFLNKIYGDDWWDEWEIETIFDQIYRDFKVIPNNRVRDKVLALRHLSRSDAAFDDWYEFVQLAQAFTGAISDFENLRMPSAGSAINAMMVMNYVRPDMKNEFGEDIKKFVSVVLIDSGIYAPPPSIIQHVTSTMKNMVTKEMQKNWKSIYQHLKELKLDSTSIPSIQANRLYRSEQAAKNYYFKDISKG